MAWGDPISALYLAVPTLGLVVGCALIYWIYTQTWERQGARWFVAVLLAGQVLAIVHVTYLLVRDPPLLVALLLTQFVTAFVTFAGFVVFISVYTDRDFHEHPIVRAGLAVVVVGILVLAPTEWFLDHRLLLAETTVVTEPFSYVQNEPGVGFVALVVVLMALIGYSWFVLLMHLLTTQHRGGLQLVLLLLAGLVVALAEILGELAVFPAEGFHHVVWGLLPFSVISAIALFRLRLFDVQPVARNVVVENLHDPIVILSRDRRLVDYNRMARRLWPSIADGMGEPFGAIAGPLADDLAFPAGDVETETNQQVTLPVADGRERHYSATVTTVRRRHSEEIGWYALLLRDVTEIERSRRQLELQNERLDQVSATVSHDLRNPIQVADGFTELAIDDLQGLADAEPAVADAREKLARVDRAVGRMEEIVDDVLALARDGRAVEDPEPVELAAVAREAWSNVETAGATFECALDPRWTVEADRARLLSILENLFRNAIEHGSTSSRPQADDGAGRAESPVTVTVDAAPGRFFVQDDGPGIPEGTAEEIFQYGYSSDDDGTGFGLAIVRTMVESHGWTVSVDASYRDGARFVVDVGPGNGGKGIGRGGDRTGSSADGSAGDSADCDDDSGTSGDANARRDRSA